MTPAIIYNFNGPSSVAARTLVALLIKPEPVINEMKFDFLSLQALHERRPSAALVKCANSSALTFCPDFHELITFEVRLMKAG